MNLLGNRIYIFQGIKKGGINPAFKKYDG